VLSQDLTKSLIGRSSNARRSDAAGQPEATVRPPTAVRAADTPGDAVQPSNSSPPARCLAAAKIMTRCCTANPSSGGSKARASSTSCSSHESAPAPTAASPHPQHAATLATALALFAIAVSRLDRGPRSDGVPLTSHTRDRSDARPRQLGAHNEGCESSCTRIAPWLQSTSAGGSRRRSAPRGAAAGIPRCARRAEAKGVTCFPFLKNYFRMCHGRGQERRHSRELGYLRPSDRVVDRFELLYTAKAELKPWRAGYRPPLVRAIRGRTHRDRHFQDGYGQLLAGGIFRSTIF